MQTKLIWLYIVIKKNVNWSMYIKKKEKVLGSGQVNSTPTFLYNNPHNIQCCFELMCFTYWMVFHFESNFCCFSIRLKLNQDLIAWRDMAGRNWITTILSHHGWCTWSTVINGQGITAETWLVYFSRMTIPKNWSLPAATTPLYFKR